MPRGPLRFLGIAASIALGAAFGFPLGAFVGYDLVAFQPALAEAQRVVANAPPQDRSPPEHVSTMICVAHHGRLDVDVARAILFMHPRHERTLLWHLNFYLTDWAVRVHISAEERVAVYATLRQANGTRGLTALARGLFQKDPKDLTIEEAATVVLTMADPRIFKFPDLIAKRKAELMAAVHRIPALMNDCTN